MELIKKDKQYQGTPRSVLADIYRDCEAQRYESILFLNLDFQDDPPHVFTYSYSLKKFAEAIIQTAEGMGDCPFLDLQKKFHDAIASDPQAKATVLEVKLPRQLYLYGEIGMTPESFAEYLLVGILD